MEWLLRSALKSLITQGALAVTCASGRDFVVGDGSKPELSIRFTTSRAQWAFLLDPELKFGELFMDSRLLIEQGSLYGLISLLLRNDRAASKPAPQSGLSRLRFAFSSWQQRNSRQRAERNVAHHYDLGDDLYALFLDADWQYSCAYFEHQGQSLDAAQLAKKRHIAAKLLLEPGQRVLEIGCGWGGMALYLADVAQAGSVLGITLSKAQLATAQRRAAERGLADRVGFSLTDYRELSGRFDRIVSVGMFEHVGLPYYTTYFQHCRRLLSDDGVMLLHTIGCTEPPVRADPWLDKYIFPGGYTPTLSQLMPAIEASGLMVCDIEILRLHYAETLRHWRERFLARRDEALALADERFCRMWEFYLAACEAAFRLDDVVVFQVQLAVKRDGVPITRNYLSEREAALRLREQSLGF